MKDASPGPAGDFALNSHWVPRQWVIRHLHALVSTLGVVLREPGATVGCVATIAIAMAVPAALFALVGNVHSLSDEWEAGGEISVYLSPTYQEEGANRLAADIDKFPRVDWVEVIGKSAALAEYEKLAGLEHFDTALGNENPLPIVLVVAPKIDVVATEIQGLVDKLSKLEGVEIVQSDVAWMHRLRAVTVVVDRVLMIFGLLFGMAVVLIVGNTVRLGIRDTQDEIEVAKLIGATDAFIRRAFLYKGIWYGVLGGLLAWMLVGVGFVLLHEPINRVAVLYESSFVVRGHGLVRGFGLLGIGAVLGLLGAWIAVVKHLAQIQPS